MKNILIIGLNIGKIYENYFKQFDYKIYTLDTDIGKTPTFTSFSQIPDEMVFDVVIISTPNYTHEEYLKKVIYKTTNIFIEKPGLCSYERWKWYIDKYPSHKIIMIKNNVYRLGLFEEIHNVIEDRKELNINIKWCFKNRIPFPGYWFTNKKKSFGGVSVDLGPHLLSYLYGIVHKTNTDLIKTKKIQQYTMEMITTTDYGEINPNNPIYDVDDYIMYKFLDNETGNNYTLEAAWAGYDNDVGIIEIYEGEKIIYEHEIGLCPEEIYYTMIDDYLNEKILSYETQKKIDLWIQSILEVEDEINA